MPLCVVQAQALEAEGELKVPAKSELRGVTRDEAVRLRLDRLKQPVLALGAPETAGADGVQAKSKEQEEEDREEAERIEQEFAETLNDDGTCMHVFCTRACKPFYLVMQVRPSFV